MLNPMKIKDYVTLGNILGGLAAMIAAVEGSLDWEGFPLTCREFTIRVGDNTLLADGVLGEPPRMLDTDFTIRGKGPDISSLAALFGLDLPADPFQFEGRLLRVESGLRVEALEGRAGRTRLAARGFIGDPPGCVFKQI